MTGQRSIVYHNISIRFFFSKKYG